MFAPVVVLTCLVCGLFVAERAPRPAAPARAGRFRELRHNRPFLQLVAGFALSTTSSQLPATLLLYYVPYVLQSAHAERYLLLYLGVGIACVPLWLFAARRREKRSVWIAAMALNGAAHAAMFMLGPAQQQAFLALVVLGGCPMGALVALPASMQADTVDHGELHSGRRREGLYLGVWSLLRKATAATGLGLALWTLDAAGYVPGVEQSEPVRAWLAALFGLVPALLHLLAIAVVWRYPITRARHGAILAELSRADANGGSGDGH